jgi:hypothetical protein
MCQLSGGPVQDQRAWRSPDLGITPGAFECPRAGLHENPEVADDAADDIGITNDHVKLQIDR